MLEKGGGGIIKCLYPKDKYKQLYLFLSSMELNHGLGVF